ncbi:hypothetical protein NM688_g5241 [Phlebia brevispora]|uniref:Uncharacterized protein n=1 Tax=Phlebia brevispora TaxID=194682 RepID=A0ACC1SYJ0_9APHY|nr:hypothetical protein NM688_g5241 [Phlebia brevispora]
MLMTTYARRNSRNRQPNDVGQNGLPSSPLEDLSPGQEITLAEMSRRMKKRSRLVLSGSQLSLPIDAVEPSSKKQRSSGRRETWSVAKESVPSTPFTLDRPLLPLGTQQIYDSLFETPAASTTSIHGTQVTSADQLSPIPVARRMLSRSNSRNLKENKTRTVKPGLASPFSSRPGSRASSPFRAPKSTKRPALHNKSRTLSTNLPKVQKSRDSLDIQSTNKDVDSIMDSTCFTSAPTSVSHTGFHTRTGSIPALTSALFETMTSQDWLVPPKVLSRSPTASDDLQLDAFQAEHPSFYFDIPAKASTPPRKRSTTITQRSFDIRIDSQSDEQYTLHRSSIMDEDKLDEDAVMSDCSLPIRPARRRRRTVVHMSSDSIFSSALDFSAYTSDDSAIDAPTSVYGSENVQTLEKNTDNTISALDPAFSPALVYPTASQVASARQPAEIGRNNIQRPSSKARSHSGLVDSSQSHAFVVTPGSQSHSHNPETEADMLHEMFTTLELDGAYTGLCMPLEALIFLLEYLGPPDSPVPHCPGKASNQLAESETPSVGHAQEQTYKRRRGDTIRASDFPRPSVSFGSACAFGSKPPAAKSELPTTRRARSGTVTLTNVQSQPVEVLITDGIRTTYPRMRTRVRKQNFSRQPPGPATIIMKIDDEPLPPPGSDEEDDELLLTGQVWTDSPSG